MPETLLLPPSATKSGFFLHPRQVTFCSLAVGFVFLAHHTLWAVKTAWMVNSHLRLYHKYRITLPHWACSCLKAKEPPTVHLYHLRRLNVQHFLGDWMCFRVRCGWDGMVSALFLLVPAWRNENWLNCAVADSCYRVMTSLSACCCWYLDEVSQPHVCVQGWSGISLAWARQLWFTSFYMKMI